MSKLSASLVLATLALLPLACTSETVKQSERVEEPQQPFDPLGGEYPQIMWMVNVLEAEGPLAFGMGGVIEHRRADEQRTMAFGPGGAEPLFAFAQRLPGYRNVAAPAVFSKPGQHGVVEPGATDKAGQSVGPRRVEVAASFRNSDTLAITVEARDGDENGSNALRTNSVDVAVGGALALILPSPNSDTWSIIVLRPTVLKAVADFPFQTESAAYDPLQGEYPQIFWIAHIYETPSGIEITDDGRVIHSTRMKPRGLGVIEGTGTQKLFESINALSDMSEVSEPSLMTKLDATGRIEIGATDKARRASISHSLEVKGSRADRGLQVESMIQNSIDEFSISVNTGSSIVPPHGALVVVAPPPKSGGKMTLLVLEPRLLESVKDYPFQTSAPLTSRSQ